jgi:Au+-exporting ATPase
VFVLEMGSHLIPGMHEWVMATIGMQASWYLQFVLTLLVLAIPGRRFYQKGFPALLRLAPDMNSLVAVGTAAAFGYSVVATFRRAAAGGHGERLLRSGGGHRRADPARPLP